MAEEKEMQQNATRKKRRLTKSLVLEAYKAAGGLHTYAAKYLGVDRSTLWRYLNKHPEVRKEIEEMEEELLDYAERKLLEKIQKGNLGAILFYLKCKGKKRGYIERQEITGEDGSPIQVTVKVKIEDDSGKDG